MTSPIKVFADDRSEGAVPAHTIDYRGEAIACLDSQRRVRAMLNGARAVQGAIIEAGDSDDVALERCLRQVHDGQYLDFLRAASESVDEGEIFYRHDFFAPGLDAETGVVRGTYAAALASARQAFSAARAAGEGGMAMALCQPPGHHAGRRFLGGYCYLNNAAVAAYALMEKHDRVAIIDFDFHFGNGTADIARHAERIVFCSSHCSTELTFPRMREPSAERDDELFLPFKYLPDTAEFLAAVRRMVDHALSRRVDALVVSAGFDIIAGDPHGKWNLPASVLREIGGIVAAAELPLCIVQEGGYDLDTLPGLMHEFLTRVTGGRRRG